MNVLESAYLEFKSLSEEEILRKTSNGADELLSYQNRKEVWSRGIVLFEHFTNSLGFEFSFPQYHSNYILTPRVTSYTHSDAGNIVKSCELSLRHCHTTRGGVFHIDCIVERAIRPPTSFNPYIEVKYSNYVYGRFTEEFSDTTKDNFLACVNRVLVQIFVNSERG
jgi:hypothetical protein